MRIIIAFLFLIHFNSFSQDSIRTISPYPKKATLLSLFIPGSGQIYNDIFAPTKRYNSTWKVPLIYTSLFFSSKLLIEKIQLEKEIRNEYNNRYNLNIYSSKWANYDDYNLVLLQQSAAKSRNTMYFVTTGIYIIQAIEASIDAHFTHFDLSPDLSLNVSPYIHNNSAGGIRLSFNLK
jgi:hypothetical protein